MIQEAPQTWEVLADWYDARMGEDGDLWHRSFSRFDAEDSWQALTVTARLFGRLAREIAKDLHYAYDQEVENNILSFIDRHRGPDGG